VSDSSSFYYTSALFVGRVLTLDWYKNGWEMKGGILIPVIFHVWGRHSRPSVVEYVAFTVWDETSCWWRTEQQKFDDITAGTLMWSSLSHLWASTVICRSLPYYLIFLYILYWLFTNQGAALRGLTYTFFLFRPRCTSPQVGSYSWMIPSRELFVLNICQTFE